MAYAPEKETAAARIAYADYLAMGDGRSIKDLHAEYVRRQKAGERVPTTNYVRLRTWSAAFKWRERVLKALQERTRQAELEEAKRLAKRRAEMRDTALSLSQRLVEQANQMLEWPIAEARVQRGADGTSITVLMPAKWTKQDAARYADTAMKLAALATDSPTENVRVSGKIRVSEVIAEIPADVIEEQHARREAAQAATTAQNGLGVNDSGDDDGDDERDEDEADSDEGGRPGSVFA